MKVENEDAKWKARNWRNHVKMVAKSDTLCERFGCYDQG